MGVLCRGVLDHEPDHLPQHPASLPNRCSRRDEHACQTPHDWSVNPIFIGYDARGPYYNENSAFNGTMDEVAIFNRALTSE